MRASPCSNALLLPHCVTRIFHFFNIVLGTPYTDGSNVREVILSVLESLIEKMDFKEGGEDTQALILIVNMLRNIIDDKGIDSVSVRKSLDFFSRENAIP